MVLRTTVSVDLANTVLEEFCFVIFGIKTRPREITNAFQLYRRFGGTTKIHMKQTTLSLLCLAAFAVSGIAQEQPAADNTAKNQRDRSGETMTSGDQSNSPEDTKLTAAIRRAVLADESLSMTAKNVKIITASGMVTLRGPVKTEAEKATVEKLAQSAAGSAKIDNQLEVKASE